MSIFWLKEREGEGERQRQKKEKRRKIVFWFTQWKSHTQYKREETKMHKSELLLFTLVNHEKALI